MCGPYSVINELSFVASEVTVDGSSGDSWEFIEDTVVIAVEGPEDDSEALFSEFGVEDGTDVTSVNGTGVEGTVVVEYGTLDRVVAGVVV